MGLIALGLLILLGVGGWGYRSYRQTIKLKQAEQYKRCGGISEVRALTVGGTKQYLLIEGQNRNAPVCLFLHGGPGAPFPFGVSARLLYPEITQCCVAVYYDQRGAGKSYSKEIDPKTMNVKQFVSDANEMVDYVRNLLQQDQIFLAGASFGTIIGAQLVHLYPEKFHGYIALGQVTDIIQGQHLAYARLLKQAEQQKDAKTEQRLRALGEPPYFGEREQKFGDLLNRSIGSNYRDDNTEPAKMMEMVRGALTSPDYSIGDLYKALVSGARFSILECEQLQNEILKTDLFAAVPTLDVPVYFFQGKHDLITNYELAKKYYDELKASAGKVWIELRNSAHYPNNEDFTLFLHYMGIIFEKQKERQAYPVTN